MTGAYVIYDSTGTIVQSSSDFATDPDDLSACEVSGGDATIGYRDRDNSGYGTILGTYVFDPPLASGIATIRKLVAVANSKVWYEDI